MLTIQELGSAGDPEIFAAGPLAAGNCGYESDFQKVI